MLSLFDRVDEYPAVENDQRHLNLCFVRRGFDGFSSGARYRHWDAFVVVCACAMVGLGMRSGGQRSISDPEKSRLCLHRVAHMPTIEITEFSS